MSFVPVPPGSDFTLANLPYGVCIDRGSLPWTAVRLGDHVINLSALQRAGCFSGPVLSKNSTCFQKVRPGQSDTMHGPVAVLGRIQLCSMVRLACFLQTMLSKHLFLS
jgi:hypothetical protein